jgi:hypothetical protein
MMPLTKRGVQTMPLSASPRGRSLVLYAGLVGAVGLLALLVTSGHGYHLLVYLPFLFLLACPLLHMSMHGGHGGHRRHGKEEPEKDRLPVDAKATAQGGAAR